MPYVKIDADTIGETSERRIDLRELRQKLRDLKDAQRTHVKIADWAAGLSDERRAWVQVPPNFAADIAELTAQIAVFEAL